MLRLLVIRYGSLAHGAFWSATCRYDAPVLSYLYLWNGPASGGVDLEIHGSNFGYPENQGLFLDPNGQPQVIFRLLSRCLLMHMDCNCSLAIAYA